MKNRSSHPDSLCDAEPTMTPTRRKVDIIFNTTLVCEWDCDICCVDAVHVSRRGGHAVLRDEGLRRQSLVPLLSHESIYEAAHRYRVAQGRELDLAGKRRIIDHLAGVDARIDISGGDALLLQSNLTLLRYASERLGRHNVTLTVTGAGSAHHRADDLAPLIDEFNFTFDAESIVDVANRPNGYALGNLKKATEFARLGTRTRAELPLTRTILSESHLTRLYEALHERGIGKLLVMRLFPVGRGAGLIQAIPSREQYIEAIEILSRLEQRFGSPMLKLQCALKHLFPGGFEGSTNPCDMVRESFGLMSDGTLLASPWAIGPRGRPLHRSWVLGNLAEMPMDKILDSARVRRLQRRLDDNFGHCKIFAFLEGHQTTPMDRMFEPSDPLYLPEPPGSRRTRYIPIQAI
mgnify:CR=1 FL=1